MTTIPLKIKPKIALTPKQQRDLDATLANLGLKQSKKAKKGLQHPPTDASYPALPTWLVADQMSTDADRRNAPTSRGRIPNQSSGGAQRAVLADIIRLRGALADEQDPALKANIGETLTRLQLAAHAMGFGDLAKAGNQGDVSTEEEYAGISASGDLAALSQAMQTGAAGGLHPHYVNNPNAPSLKKLRKQFRAATDPLERDRLGQEITLRQLGKQHEATGPSPLAGSVRGHLLAEALAEARRPAGLRKAADDKISRLSKQLDDIGSRLSTPGLEATTKAGLEVERSQVVMQLNLARLAEAHRRLEA